VSGEQETQSQEGKMNEEQPAVQPDDGAGNEQKSPTPNGPSAADVAAGIYAVMQREIRSWGWWSLALGAIHLVASGFLSAPWGILLLIVGLASFYFHEAAMFVVYGVTLTWAAVSNMLGGQAAWIAGGLFQIYLAFRVFRQFFRFRQAQKDYVNLVVEGSLVSPPMPDRAVRAFPWIGGLMGIVSVAGFAAVFVSAIIVTGLSGGLPDYFSFLEGLAVNVGVLGLAVSLASLLSSYRYRLLAVLGIIGSVLTLFVDLSLVLLL
jgi:hypothetical protein